jgi:hypothetical protein
VDNCKVVYVQDLLQAFEVSNSSFWPIIRLVS